MSHTSSAPSIRVYDPYGPNSHRHRPSHPLLPAIPMAIPNPNAREDPPPPLPPPRYINGLTNGQDPGWRWSNDNLRDTESDRPYPGSDKSDSSRLGSFSVRHRYSRDDGEAFDTSDFRRHGQMSKPTAAELDKQSNEGFEGSDEERNNMTRPSLARLQSETQLGQRALHSSAQAYDKQLLSRIGGPNTPTGSVPNGFSKLAGQLKPLSMPEPRYILLDSPRSKWTSASSAGISPVTGFRSPLFENNPSESSYPSRHSSSATIEAYDDPILSGHSQRSSVDQGIIFLDPELDEKDVRDLRALNINDHSPSASDEAAQYSVKGIKRRASSPPQEGIRDERIPGNGRDLYHRRSVQMLTTRNSPAATRYPPSYGSISSNSSVGQRNSYASSWNLSVASSVTSFGGGERLSPSALSPSGSGEAADFGLGPVSPYAASRSLNRSPPRTSLAKPSHQRNPSDGNEPLHNGSTMTAGNVTKMQPFYVCECCPKKPKKFDSKEELDLHTMEKQYQCQYCPNRFKNKNEAERHQNSLHLRRHSWSCAALAGVQAAFHPSTAHPASADLCGYCGQEFANPANWEARAEHLCQIHKFGECNQAKKFYRADHFRQHLKHSHAGTSGKWTNMLENACMREEPIPPAVNGGPSNGGVLQDVINEAHNES